MKNFYLFFVQCFFAIQMVIFHPLNAQDLQKQNNDKTVLLAILARNKAHTLPTYLTCIENLDYDKKLISLYINTNNNSDQTKELLQDWIKTNKHLYNAIIFENQEFKIPETRPHEWICERFKILAAIRNKSLKTAQALKTDFYFVIDCDNFVTPCTLKDLIQKDKPIIAPMLRTIPNKFSTYSNYFCTVNEFGYYEDDPIYNKIVGWHLVGTIKVPLVHCTYLIQTKFLDQLSYSDETDDHEFVIFARHARKNHIDQYISNEKNYGVILHFLDDLTLQEEKEQTAKLDIFQLISNFDELK